MERQWIAWALALALGAAGTLVDAADAGVARVSLGAALVDSQPASNNADATIQSSRIATTTHSSNSCGASAAIALDPRRGSALSVGAR